jgi:L-alanine-DL-glutamate epimerase-like enolase superfamily enzyme
MGSIEKMHEQVKKKIFQGFKCIKLKIGAIDIESELALIKEIRNTFGLEIEIRVDANGGFDFDRCMPVLTRLADLKVHSIEQPLQPGQFEKTRILCKNSPIPIALDEDIIRWSLRYEKHQLLESVNPQFLVLKPGLIGGFAETSEWIKLAEERGIGWWITSALESNVALNAIAQYTSQFNPTFPQGLGTGQVFANNFTSPLYVHKDHLFHDPSNSWDLTLFKS